MVERTCTRCLAQKPATDFYRGERYRDGIQTWCKSCLLAYSKDWRLRIGNRLASARRRYDRLMILTYYSGRFPPACVCCHEDRLEFLALDHIDGGGNVERTQWGRSAKLIGWIKRNAFPPGFRVLCHNCNMAAGIYGCCPHEKEREVNDRKPEPIELELQA